MDLAALVVVGGAHDADDAFRKRACSSGVIACDCAWLRVIACDQVALVSLPKAAGLVLQPQTDGFALAVAALGDVSEVPIAMSRCG